MPASRTGAAAGRRATRRAGAFRFTITDDGCGFDPRDHRSGSGLTGMADRLGAYRGVLHVDSAPRQGTRVVGTAYDDVGADIDDAAARYSSTA